MSIKDKIRTIPDFPKKGIKYRDITTLLGDKSAFHETIELLRLRYQDSNIDIIAGIEARGFIIGAALAFALNSAFVPIRKTGKLPSDVLRKTYKLEYGTDTIEIHKDAIPRGAKVVIVDDLLATGGTVLAAASLISDAGGTIEELAFVIDLPDVGGRQKLIDSPYPFFYICEFEGE
ncbi:MAG: adenine phosphoribosyltransferase [Spirochaetes bacterium]|jgi:adenine phosphoribosyltransferase|nr:adenine phosphoribosyltransferase [Spirochaetota bacterium]